MTNFKSWKDMYLFLDRYYNFTCLQCKHYTKDLDDNKTYSDSDYARFFCPHQIAMVRLDFQLLCNEWESKDGIKLSEIDRNTAQPYKFTDEMADKIDELNQATIEEIEEIIEGGN